MIRRVAVAALFALAPAAAVACPGPSETLLFHSCWNGGEVEVALLPENLPLPVVPSVGLSVTGVYTAKESRDGDLRKPVGLFVHQGAVINPNLGRMDGILVIDPATGWPNLLNRRAVQLGGKEFDLTDLPQRRDFVRAARDAGLSVLQSHLLIVGGQIDVRPGADAPLFLRRLLFTDAHGFGIYQSAGARTLHDVAQEVAVTLKPVMALNLDMGSYDYCQRKDAAGVANCGVLEAGNTAKLSNILVIRSK